MTNRNVAIRLMLALAVTLAATILPPSSPARAQSSDEGNVIVAAGAPSDETTRWWGALGAALCAAEVRLIRVAPAIGMNPYAIAAGLSGCILAALDLVTT